MVCKDEKEIIKNLVKIRKSKITQKELASKTGLTQQQISILEKGMRTPNLSTFLKYIDGIGVEIFFENIN